MLPARPERQHRRWDVDLPASHRDDLSGVAPAVVEFERMLDTAFGPVTDDRHWYEGLNCPAVAALM